MTAPQRRDSYPRHTYKSFVVTSSEGDNSDGESVTQV
jgi:hypothetical protein